MASLAGAINLIAAVAPGSDARAVCAELCTGMTPSCHKTDVSMDGPRSALVALAMAASQRAMSMQAMLAFDSAQHLWECLCRLRAEGLKLMAEFTALCLQHLAFLAMCLDTGDFAAAGLADAQGTHMKCLLCCVLNSVQAAGHPRPEASNCHSCHMRTQCHHILHAVQMCMVVARLCGKCSFSFCAMLTPSLWRSMPPWSMPHRVPSSWHCLTPQRSPLWTLEAALSRSGN